MANDIFIDSSGFFAMLASDDDCHGNAARIIAGAKGKQSFVTTDYVLDETATLLKARRKTHLLARLFERMESSQACRIEWTDAARFQEVQAFFLKHADQAWSFTDCLSFQVMKQLRLREALTKDAHFKQAGFAVLLK